MGYSSSFLWAWSPVGDYILRPSQYLFISLSQYFQARKSCDDVSIFRGEQFLNLSDLKALFFTPTYLLHPTTFLIKTCLCALPCKKDFKSWTSRSHTLVASEGIKSDVRFTKLLHCIKRFTVHCPYPLSKEQFKKLPTLIKVSPPYGRQVQFSGDRNIHVKLVYFR